ncbi:MAG: nitrilase-related carbon-nitrogen hydrolase, partial [bacterium]
HKEMSYRASKNYETDIIAWPETSVHRWMMQLPEYRSELYKLAKEEKIYIIFGTPDLTVSDKEYNSVYVISPEGNILGKYNKSKLIPYWEKAFTQGQVIEPINTERFIAGINICSEVFLPEVAALHVKKGANILFIHSNNGMFGYTLAPYFSSAFSVFRAVENNVYVVQIMNNGISQIVSPSGNIPIKSKLFNEEIINYRVPVVESEGTFYTHNGELIYFIITIISIIYILYKKCLKIMILRAFNINKNTGVR